MLYVFHVDAGQMTTYDMSLTLQSVASLKSAIERRTKIPSSSLVLLISGGEVLQADHMVSSYSAGTDTNPIYMFSKTALKESYLKQSVCGDLSPIVEISSGELRSETRSIEGKTVGELKASVEMCRAMQPTVHTVINCANLAQQFSDLAHDVSRSCETLVHEQHLQHQGWAAVVANLEDIYNEFTERSKNFKESFKKHRLKKEEYHEQLNTLNEVLESLGKIPILPALRLNAEAHRFSAFDVFEETEFLGHHYHVNQTLDNSSENRGQDFGVEVFKLSEEDVFENKESSDQAIPGSSEKQELAESDEGVSFKAQSYESSKEEPTLLHWILAQGNKAALQDILDYCQKGLALIDAEPLKEHEADLYKILEYANMQGLKQIKGIEERLYGLEQLLKELKKLVRDQHDQAASLIQYRDRLTTACDPSVLPTLVQSHWCQLEKLLTGHQMIVDIRKRIAKSKDEFSHILKARLGTVLRIENSMSVQDAHAMLSFQCFNRLARYFDIVSQLHQAPALFVRAVHEVARRRTFSVAHLQWATNLASELLHIYQEEVNRRQDFNALFEGHFLKSLFPGMSELPPSFATQAPSTFDGRLPALTDSDVEVVSSTFPHLAQDIPNYDMESTVLFFKQRLCLPKREERNADVQVDFNDQQNETENVEDKPCVTILTVETSTSCAPETMAVSMVTEVRETHLMPDNTGILPGITVFREEFENSEFYIEESLPSSLEWGRNESQENMDTHKLDISKLQEFLRQLCGLCRTNLILIRSELEALKTQASQQKIFIQEQYIRLLEAMKENNEESETRFREQTQRLTVDHELELSDMKAAVNEKVEIINSLKKEKEDLIIERQKEIERLEKEHQCTKDLLEQTRNEIATFDKKIELFEVQKQKDMKDLQEKLHQEYKAEIESLRARFRLVTLTNMDRSPSESSLEKIERTDVIEISSHNAIVMQTKENAEVEKEEAVRQAVAKLEAELKEKFEAEIVALKAKYEVEKQATINDVNRRLLSEKDKQIEVLRDREQALIKECSKYRETIQQLTDPETNDYDSLLKTQMATLENEKALLQKQVQDLKKELEKKPEDTGDKSKDSEDSEGRSSEKKEESKRWKYRCHTPVGLGAGTLSLSSCLPGHNVLLLWEPAHLNYIVLQESPTMFFVHSDCLPGLDLSVHVKNESDRRLYLIATVESKEFCYAKKITGSAVQSNESMLSSEKQPKVSDVYMDEEYVKSCNRYNMPRGARFYRVRAKPYKPHLPVPPCCDPKVRQDAMKGHVLSALENRPLKKWLTYMHAPDMQKSVDTSQSTSSATDEVNRIEVATATLINLESPVTPQGNEKTLPETSETVETVEPTPAPPDSIDLWQNAKMQQSSISTITDMECSVGRCPGPEPVELTASSISMITRGNLPPGSEMAEEATP